MSAAPAEVVAAAMAGHARGDSAPSIAHAAARGAAAAGADLADVLTGELGLCFANNTPVLWKLLEFAMSARLVVPIHALALLTQRVVPHRSTQPEAYRLYLELLSRYGVSALSSELVATGQKEQIAKSLDDALKLSHTYGVSQMDFGKSVILYVLHIITTLVDCIYADYHILGKSTSESYSSFSTRVDVQRCLTSKNTEHQENLKKKSTIMAMEIVEKITAYKKTQILLRLLYINMPQKFSSLLEKMQLLEANISRNTGSAYTIRSSLGKATSIVRMAGQSKIHGILGAFVNMWPSVGLGSNTLGAGNAARWISFDILMETAMDSGHLSAISTVEILTELIKTLQVINQATWHETFQALWVSALRFVQRGYEPLEGPLPHLTSRLCMLLAVVPLSIVPIMDEDDMQEETIALRKKGLSSSLRELIQFTSFLPTPDSLTTAANCAARRAAVFLSKINSGDNRNIDGLETSAGNMKHLIVEACIARKLVDTSAYLWPGYVVPSERNISVPTSPWSAFLDGAPLTKEMENALTLTPASSDAELEKMYHVALSGSEEEKLAASKILCGASLVQGWNIQERVVKMVVSLLSPRLSPDISESAVRDQYISHMPILHAILTEFACHDTAHILSLYGMVPEVAATLMPLCEVYGSLSPSSCVGRSGSDGVTAYTAFSSTFLFLLRLWKFHRPPQEHCFGDRGTAISMELTLEYLLLLHNNRLSLQTSSGIPSQSQPVYIESFPKLLAWYRQNQACIASSHCASSSKAAIQVADTILHMIFHKINRCAPTSGSPRSTSGSSTSCSADTSSLSVPAWEVLEAVPYVLNAALNACAHGNLSSKDLITGLRDLVDFLPASLAVIITYFSSEVTRGVWKPVPLNGVDWPSPGGYLFSVEAEIKELLASVDVHIDSHYPNGVEPILPLPMVALISLTITFKIDKTDYLLRIIGQALEICAGGSSWWSTPIIGALWTQKARKWHDFVILSCARSPFSTDERAIIQLVRSCFASFLGLTRSGGSKLTPSQGCGGLLSQTLYQRDGRISISPGHAYIRSCWVFHDSHFICTVILKMVIERAHALAKDCTAATPVLLRSGRISFSGAAAVVQQVAALAASMICVTGGVKLVQAMYDEILLTLLSAEREEYLIPNGPSCGLFEGYAIAYAVFYSGVYIWGVGDTSPAYTSVYSSRRARVINNHLKLVGNIVERHLLPGCAGDTWKAYVVAFVGLLVNFAPTWVREMELETTKRLADGLRSWDEGDLALSLLELGGPQAITTVVTSIL